ncbi:hypothetical protein EVAR_50716_1 [Eumeta japonica]|uniref:Uncharacterized protein n=1 Tax=Eumeta variegata TaxID=151549 RepID=A0A4C1YSF4_EUMVA|nr:hypothetical protein EVAR_50716_1 [Eumeta japonica]
MRESNPFPSAASRVTTNDPNQARSKQAYELPESRCSPPPMTFASPYQRVAGLLGNNRIHDGGGSGQRELSFAGRKLVFYSASPYAAGEHTGVLTARDLPCGGFLGDPFGTGSHWNTSTGWVHFVIQTESGPERGR